jgi:hypothetical protein
MIESLLLLVQLSLGLVFLAAFVTKVRAPAAFLRGVAEHEILPPPLARAAGALLIPTEGFLGLAHLTGWMLIPALFLGLATLSAFALAVGVNLRRRRDLPCHCFGSGNGERISGKTLARLSLMLGGELAVLAGLGLAPETLHHWVFPARLQSASELVHTALLCVLLLTVSAWLLRALDLWSLFESEPCPLCSPLSKEEKRKRRS